MRYDAEHKQRTRDKVVKAAARAIRARGPDGIGIADVMADVGLTHGGFYAHFGSKDELVAAAVGQMFEEARARLAAETQQRPAVDGLRAYVDFYLSAAHRDARRAGCPVAALSSDLPRMTAKLRRHFAAGSEALVEALAALLGQIGHAEPMAEARSVFAELLGALSIARIESDAARSDEILASSRTAIKRRLGLDRPA
ncbi:MAG: TetR family transcriptional regulator [Lysobacterales bacterium 69-70]|nr:TetR/AcrR family transcriptional regulator [Xanthomonadaceae bacterium]ODU32682.1 MAG: TetR family transcriptional regulator [Xanthomonadaceae bacterium SCN 69-320]ODV19193.1 MAG: TetR family transcriptional regulator [Xanthomonadaceae bacterium SCN 69-25]OJY99674.1 MAG: TetR family transcriptional regulator [Xanthomonadales bacterium 69-70]